MVYQNTLEMEERSGISEYIFNKTGFVQHLMASVGIKLVFNDKDGILHDYCGSQVPDAVGLWGIYLIDQSHLAIKFFNIFEHTATMILSSDAHK